MLQRIVGMAISSNSEVLLRLKKHFGGDAAVLPVIQRKFEDYERANLHLALEQLVKDDRGNAKLLGVVEAEDHVEISLAKITHPTTSGRYYEGSVLYVDVPVSI